MASNRHQVDFLVIGSGVAGLTYALKVAEHGSVAIITKKNSVESNTNYAQGGIAAVMDASDSTESHFRDTIDAGAGLCDHDVVRLVVEEGPDRIRELMEFGAKFTSEGKGLHLGREGGHSAHRIVHAADATGREVERALVERVRDHPNIEVLEFYFALELITEHHLGQFVTRLRPDIHCYGVYALDDRTGEIHTVLARTTMLSTGGSGEVYLHTTNPRIATGDGVAMAYRAKARIANMEFVQFHPTSLFHPDAGSFLISEATRGAGGRLFNHAGERFMPAYDVRAELAPRDIVARAIDDQLKKRGDDSVLLDLSHLPSDEIRSHFPTILDTCKGFGIDITAEPIPVVPAAHYQCGGVMTDRVGRTSISQLYASGEVAYTGLHGANRLASNSLLEALVFSHRAALTAIEEVSLTTLQEDVPDWDTSGTEQPQEWVLVSHNRGEVQRIMWDYVGIVRSDLRLARAERRLVLLHEETEDFFRRARLSSEVCELRNLIAVAYLIVRSARMRRESRGLHYTVDYPEPRDSERRLTLV
jgi:L-aspartate oxidase